MNVRAEAPTIQAASGERAFTVTTESVENLPIANRNFAGFATLVPGAIAQTGTAIAGGVFRLGGGGQNNIMMDGVSTMDTGNNGQLIQMNVDSIAEVKVLTQGYQAEFGRSSGLQISAVTKSGTNQFRGSLYDIERNSDWNSNSWVNVQNGDPKPVSKQRDWGYTVGGPVGKPGGANRLFFFYSHEYRPREAGGDINRFRVPTALERQGDFSQTRDNNGALFNTIRDYTTGLPCTASDTRGCFQDGGVLGRIPQSRLYPTGMNILSKLWPAPNVEQVPGTRLQLRSAGAGHEVAAAPAGAPRGLPGVLDAALHGEVRRAAAGTGYRPRQPARVQRPAALEPESACAVGDRQLQPVVHDVPRGHLRVQLQRDCQSLREPAVEPRERRSGGPADVVPAGRPGRSVVQRRARVRRRRVAVLHRQPGHVSAEFLLGQSHRQRAAEPRRPAGQHQPVARCVVQPDEAGGTAHAEGRRVLESRLQGAAARHRGRDAVPGRAQLRERHAEPARQRLRIRECRARHSELVRPAVGGRRRRVRLQQHRLVRAGQLEGEQQADAGLRPAVRLHAADLRHADPGVDVLPRSVAGVAGAAAVCDGLCRREPVLGHQPSGDGSPHRPAARARPPAC